jgi:hypothetical protein
MGEREGMPKIKLYDGAIVRFRFMDGGWCRLPVRPCLNTHRSSPWNWFVPGIGLTFQGDGSFAESLTDEFDIVAIKPRKRAKKPKMKGKT